LVTLEVTYRRKCCGADCYYPFASYAEIKRILFVIWLEFNLIVIINDPSIAIKVRESHIDHARRGRSAFALLQCPLIHGSHSRELVSHGVPLILQSFLGDSSYSAAFK